MKKDAIYSMRMSSRVREALKKAAMIERRTVASLLDKIISDYLSREGILKGSEFGTERRRFPRKKITLAASTLMVRGSTRESFPGVVLDISMGGVLITYAKGSEVRFVSVGELPHFELCLELPLEDGELCFDCRARHMRDTGDEIQIGAAFSKPRGDYLQRLSSFLM